MSQTAERMPPDPKSCVLTFGELAQQLIKDFQRKGRRVDTLKAHLNHILPILGDVSVPELGEKHYQLYERERKKQPDRQDKLPPQHRLDREIEVIKRVLRFQWEIGGELEQSYSVNAAIKFTGVSYSVLRRSEQTGFLPRSIRPILGSSHPFRTARYSFTDLEALKKAKTLRDQGCSKQALVKVAAVLCRRRGYQSNAEAFARSQLLYDGADVWEITGRAERISCLLQPDSTPAQDDETIRGFAESCFIPEELSPPRVSRASHRVYRLQLTKHVLPFFGDRKLFEVRYEHVHEFVQAKLREGYAIDTIEDWIGLLDRMFDHAILRGRYQGKPPTKSIRPLGLRQAPDYAAHSPETIRQFSQALQEPFNLWYLLRALLGLPQREICALKWCYVNYTDTPEQTIEPFTIAIRLKCVNGVVRPASDREMRNEPLPKVIAGMFVEWRKVTPFGGPDDFVFANCSGEKPLDPHNIYSRHLGPIADKLGIPRNSLYKLERTTMMLADHAGLTMEQQDSVLRLRRRPQILRPTPADIEVVRVAFDQIAERILGDPDGSTGFSDDEIPALEVVTPKSELPTSRPVGRNAPRPPIEEAVEKPGLGRPAKVVGDEQHSVQEHNNTQTALGPEAREAAFQSYRVKHKLNVQQVATPARVHRSDLLKWRKGTLTPPSSEKIKRINDLLFGNPTVT